MTLKKIIERLLKLNEEDYSCSLEVEPLVERFEDWEGIGVETVKYRYTLILESKTKTRHYVNRGGILEYEEKE